MEIIRCSFSEHKNNNAIKLCSVCKIYMCNKCEKLHSGLFTNHHLYNIDQNINDIFSGFCNKENHFDKLDYFCRSHNTLCCSSCIVKVKKKGRGQHSDCDVCILEDIISEKKEILKNNLKDLQNISDSLQTSIIKLKESFEAINKEKEELKIKIQKIFTDLRNNLNNREDELLSKVDEIFDIIPFNEKKIKDLEKLPNKIKISLEKGNKINNEWNNENELCSIINGCLYIENNIKDIKLINSENINYKSLNLRFFPEENKINELKDTIKNFGDIREYNTFLKNEIVLNNLNDYNLSGENNDIITKIGNDGYRGTLILNELERSKENSWKIKLLNSTDNFHYYLGVATSDFNINANYSHCGWYLYVYNQRLYTSNENNIANNNFKADIPKSEIKIVMNMKERTLKFIIDGKDNGIAFKDIPLDKPLYPAIYMYYENDSLQFIKN